MQRIVPLGLLALLLVAIVSLLRARASDRLAPSDIRVSEGVHFLTTIDPNTPGGAAYLQGLHSGDWKRAEREVRRVVRRFPNSAAAHFHLGVVLHWRGKQTEGVRELKEALRCDRAYTNAVEMLKALNAVTHGANRTTAEL